VILRAHDRATRIEAERGLAVQLEVLVFGAQSDVDERAVDRPASPDYLPDMLLAHTLPAGFIAPCLPMTAPRPPSGPLWLHEVKHDGFRVIARKDGLRVRLYSRQGNDLTNRFSRIVEAMARLPSCTLDGEAVACDDTGSRHSTCFYIASATTMCVYLPSI
jgi:hypothetical protein